MIEIGDHVLIYGQRYKIDSIDCECETHKCSIYNVTSTHKGWKMKWCETVMRKVK